MSDFEMAYLFNEYVDVIFTILFGYISVTSGFLTVTYFVGAKLPRFIAGVVVSLYSVASIPLIVVAFRYARMLDAIRNKMGDSLQWHPAAYEPHLFIPLTFYTFATCLLAIFIASIWYFYRVRVSGQVLQDKDALQET